jgi:glutathione S-transferase
LAFDKLGGIMPTIVHGHKTIRGMDDCLKYIDKTFGKMVPGGYLFSIYPHDFTSSNSTRYCNLFVNDMLPWSFYPYLLYQQESKQDRCEQRLLRDIKFLIENFVRGPFLCGKEMTIGDLMIAPFFERICVLKEFRDFEVPHAEEYDKWHVWRAMVTNHPAVYPT